MIAPVFGALPAQAATNDNGNAEWQGIWNEFVTLVKQIWVRITYAANIANNWIEVHLHINFGKIIRFIADIIIWILESLIKIVQWLVGLVT